MIDAPDQIHSTRRFWTEHVRGAGLVTLLLALPVAQLFLPRVGPFFAAIAIVFCIIAQVFSPTGARWSQSISGGVASNWLYASLALALGWAALSLLWGMDRFQGIDALATVCAALAAGWFLAHHFALIPYERLPIVVLLGVFTGAAAIFAGLRFEDAIRSVHPSDYTIADFNRIAVSLAVLLPPLILVAGRSLRYRVLSLVGIAVATIAIFQSESESAKVGLMAAAVAGLVVFAMPILRKAITVALALTIGVMPFAIDLFEAGSRWLTKDIFERGNVTHRLAIWRGYADQVMENFWFGWGLRSDIAVGSMEETQRYVERIGLKGSLTSPHNMALELWINVGLTGIIPVAIAVASLGFLQIPNRTIAAAFTSALVAATTIFLVGSSGFQGWLLSAFATAGAVLWAMIWRLLHVENAQN